MRLETVEDTNKESITLHQVVKDLNNDEDIGHDFIDIPYKKIKVWMNLTLADKRTKASKDKKKLATFRLHPETIKKIKKLSAKSGLSDAGLIKMLIDKSAD